MNKKRKLSESVLDEPDESSSNNSLPVGPPIIETPDPRAELDIHLIQPLANIVADYIQPCVTSFSSVHDSFACALDTEKVHVFNGVKTETWNSRARRVSIDCAENTLGEGVVLITTDELLKPRPGFEMSVAKSNYGGLRVSDIPMNTEVYFRNGGNKWYRDNTEIIFNYEIVILFDDLYHVAIPGAEDTPRKVLVRDALEIFLSWDSILALIGVEYFQISLQTGESKRIL